MAAWFNNLNTFSLDSVTSWSRDVSKYGRRAHHFKPNLNTSYFQDGRQSAIFKFFEPNF